MHASASFTCVGENVRHLVQRTCAAADRLAPALAVPQTRHRTSRRRGRVRRSRPTRAARAAAHSLGRHHTEPLWQHAMPCRACGTPRGAPALPLRRRVRHAASRGGSAVGMHSAACARACLVDLAREALDRRDQRLRIGSAEFDAREPAEPAGGNGEGSVASGHLLRPSRVRPTAAPAELSAAVRPWRCYSSTTEAGSGEGSACEFVSYGEDLQV